jgi:hypothetical protein
MIGRTKWITVVSVGFCLLGLQVLQAESRSAVTRITGLTSQLGDGTVTSYAEIDELNVPRAIGVVFTAAALENLPAAPSDGNRCLDANSDGQINQATECAGWHERVLPLPTEVSRRPDMPFKWVLLNWNPNGHIPHGIYDVRHFDVHFYIEAIEKVLAIQRGLCGPEFVRCDQWARAKLPLPSNYIHPDFKDVNAIAPAMGNHLVDLTSHEFHGQPFDHTFIYGIYDGRVTFYETMLTLKFLNSKPVKCAPIKRVPAVAITGYYPTKTCYRYAKEKDEYTVSLEDFQLRSASPPAETSPVVLQN